MKSLAVSCVTAVLLTGAAIPALAGWPGDPARCKPDAVKAGSVCMDKYEASVWQIPASKTGLIKKVQSGTVRLTDLSTAGVVQISPAPGNEACTPVPPTFPNNGQWAAPLYAVSIAGVRPTACLTWFQAQQACANSRKRLPSNAEWQLAVAGTPEGAAGDDGVTQCNTITVNDVVNTGSRSACVSNYGAFDMVGNLAEWVADWVPQSTVSGSWSFSQDWQCLAGAATTGEPGVLIRGGWFFALEGGAESGPFWIAGIAIPSYAPFDVGFRCAR